MWKVGAMFLAGRVVVVVVVEVGTVVVETTVVEVV
jgi:hypothetical protein